MKSNPQRFVFVLCLTFVVAAGVWAPTGHTQAPGFKKVQASIKAAEMRGSLFDGTPDEVAARVNNLILVEIEPMHRELSYDAHGAVSKSSKKYLLFSPDLQRNFRFTVSCEGSCTGNGCSISGCGFTDEGDCGPSRCTAFQFGATAECTCSKTSEFVPEEGDPQ